MLLSWLLYCGFATIFTGAIATLPRRTRSKGVGLFATGIASALIALFWPAREEHAARVESHIDEIMPRWQFEEHHEIQINAPPERIWAAIRDVTPGEIRLYKTLTSIRRLGCDDGENILNAPDAKPILEVATRNEFRMLADDPPRELVIGTHVAPQALAVMNFRLDGTHLTTETRVFAQTGKARRAFAIYWRLIRPGSGIIRVSWLEAIKRRAEKKS
ncbi:MAG TPA: hypothetical protein VHX14_12880 [Thermoanaerobaculia bacterium]|jgi:hypothetical protein|nr:hypothetical protein [Thermoanaerobaculia bacterium]